MGCLTKFFLSVLAVWGFTLIGWITLVEGASIWLVVLYILVALFVVDLAGILVQLVILPLNALTLGCLGVVVDAALKYGGLYLAAKLTGMFILPWILGTLWWQALLIGFTFVIISAIALGVANSSKRSSR